MANRDITQLVLGLYYGLVLVMAIYNLFIFFSLRDRAYLYYVLMTIMLGLWFANWNGLGAEYLWPESTWGWTRATFLLFGLANFLMSLFVQTFLLTRHHVPRLHYLLSFMKGCSLLFVASALVNSHTSLLPFIHFFSLGNWFLFFLAGLLVWRRGFRAARFFVLAWATFIGAALLVNLEGLGLLPLYFFTGYSFQIGHALEVILLSLALADRINLLREEKEAQETELQTAHNLQMGLMPTQAPRLEGFDLAGRCLPAAQVGGDLFQYFPQDGKLGIALADVTGHGMEAAVPVMRFSGLLESEVRHAKGLVQLFGGLNETLHAKLDRRTFVCFSMGELEVAPSQQKGVGGEPVTHVLRVCNSGCPYPLHFRAADQEIVELALDAYPLGASSRTRHQVIETRLAPGDRLVFYSDGIVEAADAQEAVFGYEQTAETIRKGCVEDLSAAALIDRLIGAVKDFAGGEPQGDDMTVVVLRVE